MIDSAVLLADTRKLTDLLVEDLRGRTESDDTSRIAVRGTYERASSAGRTDKSWEEWRDDLLAQVAAGWVLACVFVRFCEDNGLYDTPLLSGPRGRLELARDHRATFLAANPAADNREWLHEVFGRYTSLPGTSGIFGERNPLWQLSPSADGAKALVELWWATDDEGLQLRHDFTDETLDTRFLGDLYQDLSEHARKQYALLQTPEFVEEFILDRTLDPAIETFGLDEVRMIDPTCGSGHFLLGAFDRLLERWRQREPATEPRELAQRALDAVNGVDINPFAVAIARFRLLVAALRASDIHRLVDAPDFHLNLAVGDSLLHGTRPGAMFSGAAAYSGVLDHHYPTEDADRAERILQAGTYHAVVGNPPYIAVEDAALRKAYRALFAAASGKYVLSVPFMVRFHELAASGPAEAAGYVGQITSSSFMTRNFGRKLVENFIATKDLTYVIDTSGAYIPGHNTSTVVLISRNRPSGPTVRAVLGINGEKGIPEDPAMGPVWLAITDQVDRPGSESRFVSALDLPAQVFAQHPWSLQGGAAPQVLDAIREAGEFTLSDLATHVGIMAVTGEDDFFVVRGRQGVERLPAAESRRLVTGGEVRDWMPVKGDTALWPYDSLLSVLPLRDLSDDFQRRLWRARSAISRRRRFGVPMVDRGLPWWEWQELYVEKLRASVTIAFAEVETNNHFVLDRSGTLFNRPAPVIKLPDSATEAEHLELVSVLNSSVVEFWVKQNVFPKGGDQVGGSGARLSVEAWHDRYQRDATSMRKLPLPKLTRLGTYGIALDQAAHALDESLPSSLAGRRAPARPMLDEGHVEASALRTRMVALQEELDWACYHLYALTDEELTFPIDELPPLQKGERAFEIALARRIARGEATSTWFDRHGSTPVTELPDRWPDGYRQLVERRLALIESDRAIGLLERPEYKRRWNWTDLSDLESEAQRTWLLDRIEALLSVVDPTEPEATTVARLADRLWQDDDARAVAEDLGGTGVDPVKLVGKLVADAGVPYLAALRLKESGLRTREAWERTWELQRTEDALDTRAVLPADHPDHLDADELAVAKKQAVVEKIPVPPKYKSPDFRDTASWRLRGKLDVPKERFVLYPRTHVGADTSMVVGWAGWDHLQQLRALAGLYTTRKHDGAETPELTPLLAGMAELLPWVLQWHDDPDPVFGDRMGQYFTGFLDTERAALGLTTDDLTAWRP
jgi:hypothetical protein